MRRVLSAIRRLLSAIVGLLRGVVQFSRHKDGWLRVLASAASGVMLVFIAAPVNLHWLHWVSFLPMLWALRPAQHRVNGFVAWFGGWVAIFILYFWIIDTIIVFSNVPWVIAFAAHLLFTTVFSLPYLVFGRATHRLRARFGLGWTLAVPALWVAMEMIPTLFPYYHGVSQYRNPYTWQLASVLGVTGLTFLVWWVNCALMELGWRRDRRSLAMTSAAVLSLVGTVVFGMWRHGVVEDTLSQAPVVRVGLIQQNVSMHERLSEHPAKTMRAWTADTRDLMGLRPDIVVWPEGAIPFNPDDDEHVAVWLGDRTPKQFFSEWTSRYRFHLLIGGGTWEHSVGPDGRDDVTSYNSAYAYDREGILVGRYDKMVPLPFGEYIPGSSLIPGLADLIDGVGDFRAGDVPTVFPAATADGVVYRYSVPICYEAILTGPMWKLFYGAEGGDPVDLFVVITNDAWFGDTASPHQHAMLTTVQAMEFGRPMVRSAYTGVSWIVEPHGNIVGETEPFTDVATVEEVRLASFDTVYVAGGWVFPYLCIFATGGLVWVGRRRSEPENAPES